MKRLIAGLLVVGWWLGGAGRAQTTGADVEAQLKGKAVYLRGGWGENKLKFNASGEAEKKYPVLPFTESGFRVKTVQRSGDTLRLEGERFALRFDAKGEMSTFDRTPLVVEIKVAPGGDVKAAVEKIFAPDLASLVPEMPSFWQPFARKHFLPEGAAGSVAASVTDAAEADKPVRLGPADKRPKALFAPAAPFSDTGRAAKYTGQVKVYLWIDENGRPSHLQLLQPAGLGLDEEAIKAVSQYRFSPAMRDGKAVKVDFIVDVGFEIF